MPKLASLKRLSAGQIVGWIFFILAASLVLWFLWRILYFTGLLRSGTAVYALPQFSARTSSILGTPILSAKKVSKSFLEDPASPSLGDAIRHAPEEWRPWFDLAIVSKGPAAQRAITRARELNPLSPEIQDLGRR